MLQAGDLLQSSELPISAIAEQGRYTCEFVGQKAFSNVIGVPPGKYRH